MQNNLNNPGQGAKSDKVLHKNIAANSRNYGAFYENTHCQHRRNS